VALHSGRKHYTCREVVLRDTVQMRGAEKVSFFLGRLSMTSGDEILPLVPTPRGDQMLILRGVHLKYEPVDETDDGFNLVNVGVGVGLQRPFATLAGKLAEDAGKILETLVPGRQLFHLTLAPCPGYPCRGLVRASIDALLLEEG
jgi:hypothetical protein